MISISLPNSLSITQQEEHEWLETFATGGWASGTLSGAATRRYHGLLVAALNPPANRWLLLAKLDEAICVGSRRYECGCSQYPGVRHPQGYQFLKSFKQDQFPTLEYQSTEFSFRKTLIGVHGENTLLIQYEIGTVPSDCTIEFHPLVANRPIHSLRRADASRVQQSTFSSGLLKIAAQDDIPGLTISVPESQFYPKTEWYYNVRYNEEEKRGYDFEEDLLSYGVFQRNLRSGEKFIVEVSTNHLIGRDTSLLFARERNRRKRLRESLPLQEEFTFALGRAADQFIVRRGNTGRSIIAGYHWFNDWGRDAMIALPGLCLVTQRFEDAKRILLTFSSAMQHGLLPNNFADDGSPAGYNSIDATLWYFVALYQYLRYTNDTEFVAHLLPALHDIIDAHVRGTIHDIHLTDDGLLSGGNPTIQLTWMDAKVGDWVVTARQGKAVEVNALWYNTLSIMSVLCTRIGFGAEASRYATRARVAKQRFQELFWNGESDCLFDYIDGSSRDTRIRPNQILALSLPFQLIEGGQAIALLKTIEQKLLTPFGLRTLDPSNPNFQSNYGGTQASRDSAYHQGTVWPWLLGPYITATCQVLGEPGRIKSMKLLESIRSHFSSNGLGSISEIFDGNEPHTARGAIAQAWSVAEILRCYVEDICQIRPQN
jgi:predicted glycogen debranching enzyme